MPNVNKIDNKAYDPRWFIWTIVFLIVSGVSLVSYILITDTQVSAEQMYIPVQRAAKK